MDRHARQSKLAEVGELGQARIARARVDIHLEGLAADVAARYLAGAGVAGIRVREAHAAEGVRALAPGVVVEVAPALSLDEGGPAFGLRDATCQQVFRGAHAALRALRVAVAREGKG